MGEGTARARPGAGARGGRELGTRHRRPLSGRRVALTGAGGFIGSHLLTRLIAAGAAVEVLGPTAMARPEVRGLVDARQVGYRSRALLDDDVLAAALRGCDSLIHLNYRPPASTGFWPRLAEEVLTNVLPTIRLLDHAESAGVGHLCFASSTAVYTPPARGVDEQGPVGGPIGPYGMAKLEQEDCTRQWSRTTGRPAAILRLSTVYGPGETVPRAIPNFIRAVLAGRDPVVGGRGVAPFDPIHVDDTAEAFQLAVQARAGGTFNIGTGSGWAPREVAEMVMRLCGSARRVAEDPGAPDRGGPICDVTRAAVHLGFQARTALAAGLAEEIAWLRGTGLRASA